jgi:hypothetical protein
MKQKREYTDYLQDILDAAQKAEQFMAGMDMAAFEGDAKTSLLSFAPWRSSAKPPSIFPHRYVGATLKSRGVPWRGCAIRSFMII